MPQTTLSRPSPRPRPFWGLATACNGFCNALLPVARPRFGRLVPASNETGGAIRAIAAVNETLGTEDWIRITPFGEFGNPVGLQVVDRGAADKMVAAFNSVATKLATFFRGLPIYEGHPDDPEWRKANPGVRAVAVGRVKALEAREDGLWGKVAWNERGTPLVRGDAPAYTAQSPHWGMLPRAGRPRAYEPVEIWSLGLTNHPNIPGTHLGINEAPPEQSPPMKEKLIALLAALGRPVSDPSAVTDEQLAAAADEAVSVASQLAQAAKEAEGMRPKLEEAKSAATAAANEKATLVAQVAAERAARAELVVVGAINEGRITAAQKADWLGKFTAAGADFAAVQGELGKVVKAINTTSQIGGVGARKAEAAASADKIAAINEAVRAKMAGGIAHHDAFEAVKREKPELFKPAAAE